MALFFFPLEKQGASKTRKKKPAIYTTVRSFVGVFSLSSALRNISRLTVALERSHRHHRHHHHIHPRIFNIYICFSPSSSSSSTSLVITPCRRSPIGFSTDSAVHFGFVLTLTKTRTLLLRSVADVLQFDGNLLIRFGENLDEATGKHRILLELRRRSENENVREDYATFIAAAAVYCVTFERRHTLTQ